MNVTYAVWLMVAGICALLVAWLAWRRQSVPAAPSLMTMMLCMAIWSLGYGFHWLAEESTWRVFWLYLMHLGMITMPVTFLVMVQKFLGRDQWLTPWAYLLLLIVPVLSIALLWTDPLHGLFFGGSLVDGKFLPFRGGAWFYVFVFYSYVSLAIGSSQLILEYFRSTPFYRSQLRVLVMGILIPWVANALQLAGWSPFPDLDWTPMSFVGTGILFAYGFFGYRMMELVPVARDMLVEHMDDAIVVVDTKGRIVDLNPRAMQLADVGVEMVYGKMLGEVFSKHASWLEAHLTDEGRFHVKLEQVPFWELDLRVMTLRDRYGNQVGKLLVWSDVTGRKHVERQLELFFRAVEQSPVAILIADTEGTVEYVNPRFQQLTGYTLDDMRSRTLRVLQANPDEPDYEAIWNTIRTGGIWQGESLKRKKNGEVYWALEVIASVLDDQGNPGHVVVIQQDITNNKRAEEELCILNERLEAKLQEIETLHEQLREEAIRDGLTRLFNRRYLEETLDREIARLRRNGKPVSVVMMDIDRFKSVNDTFGHQAGDVILQTLGAILLDTSRLSDIACRFGGDELVVVLPEATLETARLRAEEWRVTFGQMSFTFGGRTVKLTLSLGVATFPDHAQTATELLIAADRALYRAKARRNRVAVYDPVSMVGTIEQLRVGGGTDG